MKLIEALRAVIFLLTSPRSIEFATSLVSQWEAKGWLSARQQEYIPRLVKVTGLDPSDFTLDYTPTLDPLGDFTMNTRVHLTTEQRRATALARLQSDLDWFVVNGAGFSTLTIAVGGLNHATVLRLCVLASAALGKPLGDSGPLSVDVLRQVAVARLAHIPAEDIDPTAILIAKAIAGEKPSKRGKRVAVADAVADAVAAIKAPYHPPVLGGTVPSVPISSAIADSVAVVILPPVWGGTVPSVPIVAQAEADAPPTVTADPVAPIVPPVAGEPIKVRVTRAERLAIDFAFWRDRCPAMKAYPGGKWERAADVFGIPSLKGWVETHFDANASDVPAIDPDYVLNVDRVQEVVDCLSGRVPTYCWTWGERGVGKTSFAQQIAARLGRPFHGITFCRTTDPSEIIGDQGLKSGDTGWQDGSILRALRSPVPCVILLDEISQAVADSVTGPLNEILDGGCRYRVPRTGEIVRFDPRTLFLAGDNTNGTGDVTGRYVGTRPQNAALRDRFGSTVQMTFAPKGEEIKIIVKRAECDKEIAEKAWGVMNVLRQRCNSGELADPPSLRECVAFANKLRTGMVKPEAAFDRTFAQKAPIDAQETMRGLFLSYWADGSPLVQEASPEAAEDPGF